MKRKIINIILSIPFILIVSYNFAGPYIFSEQINESFSVIQKEFENIDNIPDAELVSISNIKKPGVVFIDGYFKSESSYEDIKSYYKDELKSGGWEFIGEGVSKDYGKDEGMELHFNKKGIELGIYYISPQYQEEEEYGRTFSLAISWDY